MLEDVNQAFLWKIQKLLGLDFFVNLIAGGSLFIPCKKLSGFHIEILASSTSMPLRLLLVSAVLFRSDWRWDWEEQAASLQFGFPTNACSLNSFCAFMLPASWCSCLKLCSNLQLSKYSFIWSTILVSNVWRFAECRLFLIIFQLGRRESSVDGKEITYGKVT